MYYSVILFFLTGWSAWFLIDKDPASLGVLLPSAKDEILDNFQLGFNLLKHGYFKASYAFLWHAHYFVLSLIGGFLLSMVSSQIVIAFRRREFWRRYVPIKRNKQSGKKVSEDKSQNDL